MLRRVKIDDVKPFDYGFGGAIKGRMQDVGRTLGSKSVGLIIQTIAPGNFSSRRHKHVFQEEILLVMSGTGTLIHGDERIAVSAGDCFCYLPEDAEAHTFENTGTADLVLWAFGNRFDHEIAIYPDHGVAFVEGLGADVPLDTIRRSEWTEERRKK